MVALTPEPDVTVPDDRATRAAGHCPPAEDRSGSIPCSHKPIRDSPGTGAISWCGARMTTDEDALIMMGIGDPALCRGIAEVRVGDAGGAGATDLTR